MSFIVLKCYQCATFQVHQSKKSKKWTCKLCGAKQSVLKVYFEGASNECRKFVQDSNMKRGARNAMKEVTNETNMFHPSEFGDPIENSPNQFFSKAVMKASKWDVYKPSIDENSSDADEEIITSTIAKRKTSNNQSCSCPIVSKRAKASPKKKQLKHRKNSDTQFWPTRVSEQKNSKWSLFRSSNT